MTTSERKNVYDIVTERLLEALEQGIVPWRRTWSSDSGSSLFPRNLVSKKPYRGVNVWLTMIRGYQSPWWVTFKQARDLGGSVRKGEKGTPIVYAQRVEDKKDPDKTYMLMRYFTVFNVEQCDGLEAKIPAPVARPAHATSEAADAIMAQWLDAPRVIEHGDVAAYSPELDTIRIPYRTQFETLGAFYQTLFHEAVHATGHKNRLNRWEDKPGHIQYGSESYSEEELIAEIGGCYLQHLAGFEVDNVNSAAYLRGWSKALQNDGKLMLRAASAAQKAVDSIIGAAFAEEEHAGE